MDLTLNDILDHALDLFRKTVCAIFDGVETSSLVQGLCVDLFIINQEIQ